MHDPAFLQLRDARPVAVGQHRAIYVHPDDPALLVKVMREEVARERWQRWPKRLQRALHATGYVRELKEYIAVRARHPGRIPPISRMAGVVDTDLGLGLVSELVAGDDGAPGPTLAAIYERERGFQPWLEQALETLLRDLLACEVILGDLHPWNIVHGSDSRGGPRLVVVDGFGEKHLVPIRSLSRAINRWNTRRLFRQMRENLVRWLPVQPTG